MALISIDKITFGFTGAPRDGTALVSFFDGERCLVSFLLNTRAPMPYVGMPDCPMLSTLDRFRWTVSPAHDFSVDEFQGSVRFTDRDGVSHTRLINSQTLTL